MKFAYEYQPAAWGDAARATPGGSPGNRERSPAAPVLFPPSRPDSRGYGPGSQSESYPRYQSNTVTLAASTEFQEVIRFAGRPKVVDLSASAAGVEYRFRNRGETPTDAIRAPGTAFHETHLSKEIVEARDPTGAGGQIVTAHGMWTDPATT